MLVTLLVLSVAFTMACVLAEANPPKPKFIEPTKVVVEMQEDNDFDEDPPTVVSVPRNEALDITRFHRIEIGLWSMVSPSIRNALLRALQFFT